MIFYETPFILFTDWPTFTESDTNPMKKHVRFSPGSKRPATESRRLLTVFFFLLLLPFALCATVANADNDWLPAPEQNTVFLPFKINTGGDIPLLQSKADEILAEALINKKQSFFPRSLAEEKIDYNGAWPPPPPTIDSFSLMRGIDYLIVGTLSQIGQKISLDFIVYGLTDITASRYFYKTADTMNDFARVMHEVTGEILAHTGRYHQIGKVTVKGNSRIDSGAILRNTKSTIGDRFDPQQLRDDIKQIFKMGFFEDVRVNAVDSPSGKEIIVEVKEKDVIGQVKLVDNKELDEKTVRDVLTVTPNTIINDKEIKKSIDNIKRLYKEKGFYNTEVAASMSHPRESRVDVQFVITEGVKVFVKEIRLSGNQTFNEKELKKVIESSEKGLFSWLTDSGVLKREILEQDVARIGAFYHNNGFIDAKISDPEIRQEGEWLYITFSIAEGDRYQVGQIDITGNLIVERDELLGKTTLGAEEFFSRKVLRDDIMSLNDFYAEKGYAFAEITPQVEKDDQNKRVDVRFQISKNELVSINRIIIRGNTRTRDKVIRREMEIKEMEIFNATALKKSNANLQRLSFFEDISITPEPTAEPDRMDIIVDVKEKPTGTFSIGAGYSSVDSFMFMGEISQNNFMGRGQQLALQANMSGNSTRYNLKFTEPRLNDSKLLFGTNLYNWIREYDDYTKDSKGLTFRFGYPIWKKLYLGWSYGYDKTDLSDINYSNVAQEILDSIDINVSSYATVSLSHDTRNNYLSPSSGSVHVIETKYSGGPLGGDAWFTKVEGSTSWYFPIPFESVLHFKGAAGYVTENTGGKLPIYERFYLGGISTIRGFKSGQISPKDPATGDRVGGDKMAYGTMEVIFPLVKDAGLDGVVFVDAGNVYAIGKNIDFGNYKSSVGMGFRWLSPMGPLRLEWGYNLDPVGDEDASNWDFSIGGAF